MSVKVKITSLIPEAQEKIEEAINVSLLGCGELMQDALAENTHKVTGLLSNSWNYKTKNHTSGFGGEPIKDAKQGLGEDIRVSEPDKDNAVRTGSALNYAGPYNKRFKVMENMIDTESKQLGKVSEAAFKKVIGT